MGYNYLPLCFIQNDRAYLVFLLSYEIIVFCCAPTVFMAVVYFEVGRALMKQNKRMKRVCPQVSSSRHIRDQRTFFVCVCTVLCYGIGNLATIVWIIDLIASEHESFFRIDNIIFININVLIARVAGSNSINPLIYGILDKKLFKFWKLCHKNKRGSQEN